jgi:Kef-type K+ transport system membrane component KefB
MPEVSFAGLFLVVAAAFAVPFLLGLAPSVRLPSVVVEIIAGIILGPSVLGWVHVDVPIQVLAVTGLAFLLFLSGLEVDTTRLRGRLLRLPLAGLVISVVLGLGVGAVLAASGAVGSPALIAVTLLATSLGVIVPVLKDAGVAESDFGQVVIASATLADVGAIVLLSLLFSRTAGGPAATVTLLVGLGLLTVVMAAGLARAAALPRLSMEFASLADTTAQLRIRGAVVLLVGFVALASRLGLETILGAFLAGVLVAHIDRPGMTDHPHFRLKLEGIGFGFLIPVFFVTSGLEFDLRGLLGGGSALLLVPLLTVALLVVRGVPAVAYRGLMTPRQMVPAALLQATSLPFIVTATMIGRSLGLLTNIVASALIAAGLLSVLVFPIAAVTLLRRGRAPAGTPAREPAEHGL